MIRLLDVTKRFAAPGGQQVIVDGLTLDLPSRRSLAILGRNGAGKSTLLRMIAGALPPDRGQIVCSGSVSWPLGFSGAMHPGLTGAQNARFVARVYGVDSDDLIAFAADFAELGRAMHQQVGTYSSGMRARLAFGLSMGVAFDTYLIDEVIAVGDDTFRRKCKAVFRDRLADSNLIMVSHSEAQLREYCNCALLLDRGHAVFFDDLEAGIAAHLGIMAQG